MLFTHTSYTFNFLLTGVSKLSSKGRTQDHQNNWRELKLDSRVVTETSGEAAQMFPDPKHKLPAVTTSKHLIDWSNYLLVQKENT